MKIPYGKQNINENDIESVCEVLRSDWLTQGPSVEIFEKTAIDHCGAKFACAVNSATSALHLACLALGLGKNDCLWTVPNTFVASANCALYCGAKVDFVDINSNTLNMCPQKLEEKLHNAKKIGCLPKIVVPVHFAGLSCDMRAIHKLSLEYGFKIIEDASHAIGGSYFDQPIGSCYFSDITIFSFHPVKIITTGEGGMALTNNSDLAHKMSLLRTHGITRDSDFMTDSSAGGWFYEQIDLGLNYRMTDIQACLGTSQLSRLELFVGSRNKLAERYLNTLKELPISFQKIPKKSYSAFHLFVINLQNEDHIKKRQVIFDYLRKSGIGVNVHYIPVHTHPYYKSMGYNWGDYPISEKYYNSALSLPMFSSLTDEEQDYVAKHLRISLDL